MNKADKLKLLQARLAKMQLKRAELPARPPVASGLPIGPMMSAMNIGLPPIRIELAVKAQTDPNKEQRVAGMTAPSPG